MMKLTKHFAAIAAALMITLLPALTLALAGCSAATDESEPAAYYRITLLPAVDYTFPDAIGTNYTAPEAYEILIKNGGNQSTGRLTVKLSGDNADSFVLSKVRIASIAADGTGDFTVAPAPGLDTGTYTATVTVSGTAADLTRSIAVSFTVKADTADSDSSKEDPSKEDPSEETPSEEKPSEENPSEENPSEETPSEENPSEETPTEETPPEEKPPEEPPPETAPVYSIALDVDGPDDKGVYTNGVYTFPHKYFGIGEQEVKTVRIRNTGNRPTGELAVSLGGPSNNPDAFVLSLTKIASIEPFGAADFTVRPESEEEAGQFIATVTVSAAAGNNNAIDPQSFGVTFAVTTLYHTVTFISNGGSDVPPQSIVHGGNAERPGEPNKANLHFKNWYRDTAGTELFGFTTTPVNENITLHAKWYAVVTFDPMGGIGAATRDADEGKAVVEPPNPTKEDYNFNAWYTAADYASEWNFTAPVSRDMTLYAKWGPTVFSSLAAVIEHLPKTANTEAALYTLSSGAETYTAAIVLTDAGCTDALTIDGGGRVVTGNGNVVMVGSGITLTLKDITLTKIPVIVQAGGKLVLETGAVIKENSVTGVTVNDGALEMKPGTLITKNSASGSGGGVRMEGGTFTMSGGEISDNSTTADGGGVLLAGENTVFTLSGSGEISGNTAGGYGGGVRIAFGPGMQVLNQIFNMSGGIIKNNHAEQFGGGLCSGDVLSVFNMTGGEITGNTIPTYGGGGGVYNYFTQVSVDPQIGGDTAPADGRGWIHDNLKEDWKNF